MDEFDINILGCGAATPSLRHLPSCQAIEYRGRVMLVDCGEGAQLSMRRERLKYSRVTDVFISHLHGDHFLGLPGLLSTLSLHEVGGKVRVHCFRPGIELLRHIMAVVAHDTSFEIEYNELDPRGGQTVFDSKSLTVTTFRLSHGQTPCVGFRFDEKPKGRHINGDMVRYHQVPVWKIESLRWGADFEKPDGTVIPNEMLTLPPTPSKSYAYCSDTAYSHEVAEAVRGVDLLYHEATYCEDNAAKAAERGHSTARQAARIAAEAGVGQLLLGHFSKSYVDEECHLAEAREIFPNTIIATEGMKISLLGQ